MELSRYQLDILDWVKNGKGNAIINATSGSSKSFTLLEICKQKSVSNGILLAYNTHIAKYLNDQINRRDFQAKTNHSLGRSLVASVLGPKLNLDGDKYRNLCKQELEDWLGPIILERYKEENKGRKNILKNSDVVYKALSVLNKAISLTQSTLGGFQKEDMIALDEHFLFTDPNIYIKYSEISQVVEKVINDGISQAQRINLISFEDMLYLPHVWDIKADQYSWVLLDEGQDASPGQIGLLKRLIGEDTRVVVAADSNQAINGYSGAGVDAVSILGRDLSAVNLPLSITYRCPPNHVKLVKSLYPDIDIESFKKEDGLLEAMPIEEFTKNLQVGDLVIARRTKDLVRVCLRVIGRGKKATVKGKDIGKGLVSLIEKVCKDGEAELTVLTELLNSYFIKESAKITEAFKLEALKDKIDSIKSCAGFYKSQSVGELSYRIESLFTDKNEGIVFKSCHSCKGLQSDRVFIINYFDMPLFFVDPETWQYQQELNCRFVALTRSSRDLFFVTEDEKEYELMDLYIKNNS